MLELVLMNGALYPDYSEMAQRKWIRRAESVSFGLVLQHVGLFSDEGLSLV